MTKQKVTLHTGLRTTDHQRRTHVVQRKIQEKKLFVKLHLNSNFLLLINNSIYLIRKYVVKKTATFAG